MALTDMVIMPGADYQDIVDATRERTGGTDTLKSGEVGAAIRGIQAGGGGDSGEVNQFDALLEKSITEVKSNATSIGNYAFDSCSELTKADVPAATSIGNYAFYDCSKLTTADFPVATSIGDSAFYYCSTLTTAHFPVATSIGSDAFRYCTKLTALILRSGTMATLKNTGVFTGTRIGAKKGYIYVPRALLSDTDSTTDYRQASNWSTYAAQFRALEDYTVDGTTTGALDETKIAA